MLNFTFALLALVRAHRRRKLSNAPSTPDNSISIECDTVLRRQRKGVPYQSAPKPNPSSQEAAGHLCQARVQIGTDQRVDSSEVGNRRGVQVVSLGGKMLVLIETY